MGNGSRTKTGSVEESLKFLVDGGRKNLSLAERLKMDAETAARIDREQSLQNFIVVAKVARK